MQLRLRIAVNETFFSSLLQKRPHVSNETYHRNDGILLAQSSKYGKRQLVMKNLPGDWSQSETAKCFEL